MNLRFVFWQVFIRFYLYLKMDSIILLNVRRNNDRKKGDYFFYFHYIKAQKNVSLIRSENEIYKQNSFFNFIVLMGWVKVLFHLLNKIKDNCVLFLFFTLLLLNNTSIILFHCLQPYFSQLYNSNFCHPSRFYLS